jgi:penicillin-binding protein 2
LKRIAVDSSTKQNTTKTHATKTYATKKPRAMSYEFLASNFASKSRKRILYAAILLVAAFYIGRLVQLQILEGSQYLAKSEMQAIKQVVRDPVRGAVYDRNGVLIVRNVPSFSVSVTPADFNFENTAFLARIFGADEKELRQRIEKYRRISPATPVKIFRDASDSVIAAIEENSDLLPGVSVMPESKRVYDFKGRSPHLFGYAKEVSDKQLETAGSWYRPGDVIGYEGLEASYEPFLRGTKGVEFVAVDVKGRTVASFNDGKNDLPQEDGFNLKLGIDIGLQDYIDSVMSKFHGAAVAIDPASGEILSLVSKPDYDPRLFSGRTTPQLIQAVMNDSLLPMFNRATSTIYPPGSTWKMLIALAGLQEGIITADQSMYCPAEFAFGNKVFKSHGAGNLTVRQAIKISSNSFFYQLALKLGVERFYKYGQMFGFGGRSSADVHNEGSGVLPNEKYMNKLRGKNGWGVGSLVNWGIGQGEVSVTPLQMAAYVATLANKGRWNQPHLVRSLYDPKTNSYKPLEYASHQLPIDPQHFDVVLDGMYDVFNSPGGTSYEHVDHSGVKICGKTGTAQNAHGKDHAWFVCFAPRENPVIALCVMMENTGGSGGSVAAPVAQKIVQYYVDGLAARAKQSAKPDSTVTDSTRATQKAVSPIASK